MAKVSAPLGSFEASGKIGQHSVFFTWKGYNIVRKWTKPSNPRTAYQGNIRTFTGGTGRATKAVSIPSAFYNDAKSVTPTGMTWVSHIVKVLAELFNADVQSLESEFLTVPTEARNAFDQRAEELGLVTFSAPGTSASYSRALQLYALYRYGRQMRRPDTGAFNRNPYTVAPANLTEDNVDELVSDITSE